MAGLQARCCRCSCAQGTASGLSPKIVYSLCLVGGAVCFYAIDSIYRQFEETINDVFIVVIALVFGASIVHVVTICLFSCESRKKHSLLHQWIMTRAILLCIDGLGCLSLFRSDHNFSFGVLRPLWICVMMYLYSVLKSHYKTIMNSPCSPDEVLLLYNRPSISEDEDSNSVVELLYVESEEAAQPPGSQSSQDVPVAPLHAVATEQ